MPTTVVGLEKWLQELWRDKEQALDALYKQGIAQQAARYRIHNNDIRNRPVGQYSANFSTLICILITVYWVFKLVKKKTTEHFH